MSSTAVSLPLTRQRVSSVLRRAGFRVQYAESFGRRQGIFVRQTTPTMVRIVIDIDSGACRQSQREEIITALKATKFTVNGDQEDDVCGLEVTLLADAPATSS
jgi:hypothetical protein